MDLQKEMTEDFSKLDFLNWRNDPRTRLFFDRIFKESITATEEELFSDTTRSLFWENPERYGAYAVYLTGMRQFLKEIYEMDAETFLWEAFGIEPEEVTDEDATTG